MLAQILTGKLTVKQAAQSASDNIARCSTGPLTAAVGTGYALGRSPVPHAPALPSPPRRLLRRPAAALSVSGVGRGAGSVPPRRCPSSRRSSRSSAIRSTGCHALVPALRPAGADPAPRATGSGSTTTAPSSRLRLLGHARPDDRVHGVNVALTMVLGTLIALLLVRSAPSSVSSLTAGSSSSGRCRPSSPSRSGTG